MPINGIWLRRESDHVVVLVEYPDGRKLEAIRENIDSPFSHYIHDWGLAALRDGKRSVTA